MNKTTPLITVADLRECLMGGQAVLAMPTHDITHFYERESIRMAEAIEFFDYHRDLDYVDDVVMLEAIREAERERNPQWWEA